MKIRKSLLLLSLSVPGAMLLSGCSASFQPSPLTSDADLPQTPIGEINGMVHGGQAPVTGASIYLYAAGTSGYGGSAKSLISATASNAHRDSSGNYYVLTDGAGNFQLGGDYTCTQGTQVYAVAVGGNPGLTGTVNNTAIVQMAGLGQCPAAGNLAAQVPYLVINEVSTVAFAYAMGGFATNAYNVSSSGTALAQTGIANAMLNAANIQSIGWSAGGWGAALALANGNSNSVAPQQKINMLANILATCVNTSSATSTACANLFKYATNSSGTQPTDEATAIFNIVHNPTQNVLNIWNLYLAQGPFSPIPITQPTDWTLPVVYKSAVSRPNNIAFDSSGNAWISDETLKAVVKVGPQGAVSKFVPSGAGSIYNVAVDPSNIVWAVDNSKNKVYRLNSSGTVLSTITTGTLNGPSAISFDSTGNAYVVNTKSDVVSRYNSSGTAISGTVTSNTSLNTSSAIALDTGGNMWLPGNNASCGCIVEVASGNTTGSLFNNAPFNLGDVEDSTAVAVDGSDTPWVANIDNHLLNIQTINLGGFGSYVYNTVDATGGGLNAPSTLSIDGSGNLWTANSGAATVSGFNNGGTALSSTGFVSGGTGHTYAAAVDLSGNVWTANSDGTVVQLLGLAAPTATPVLPGQLGSKP